MKYKSRLRHLLLLAISAHILSACVAASVPISVNHVSTSRYQDFSCEALFEEILKTEEKIPALKQKQRSIQNKNLLLYGGGLLGLLLRDKEGVKPELGEAIGDYDSLELAWLEKGCEFSDFSDGEVGQTDVAD